ncbi:MAG: alcohol dehydrogenase [Stenotrophomonas maltophilia]|nr:MAG: alcohol dehydrogenase [Stenotrophomonas maltophilia]
MRCYRLTGENTPLLTLANAADPLPREGEVRVDIRAVSLNYRDLIVAGIGQGSIPVSDGAGVVSALGANVEGLQVGDRVVIGFMPGWAEGEFSASKQATSLGGPQVDGVLAERIVVPASGVCRIPDSMSFEQAATLPCAAVTAWSALFERRPLQPGETVLLLGTGGVSIFALQLAKAAGARVIITSSADDKLERARALGADHLINYRQVPNWEEQVLRLTDGLGADLAVDVAGPATLNQTLKATRHGGRISLMGVLTGFDGQIDTLAILEKRITLQGIYVGSVATLRALTNVALQPAIDRVYAFEDAEAAFQHLRSASHFGKIVIRVAD